MAERPKLNLAEAEVLKSRPKLSDKERAREQLRVQENQRRLERDANFQRSRQPITRAQVGLPPLEQLTRGIDPSVELFEKTRPTTGDRDDEFHWYQSISGFLSTWWNAMSNISKKMHDAAMAMIGNSKA